VDELRTGPDSPDEGGRPERSGPEDGGGEASFRLRQRIEPRSRAECAAELEQRSVSGWAPEADRSPDVTAEVLRRFEPGRAGLPEVSTGEAAAYLDAHRAERPWLAAAGGCRPEVQRIFAALDQGGGHAHIRHEGWVTEEMNQRRVAYLEDPAQLDPAKRAAGIDGIASGAPHRCRGASSRVTDPEAFAVAFARGVGHPAVRAALDTKFADGQVPPSVSLPVSELLGPGGHRYCTGWRLQPVEGSMTVAREYRAAWVDARARGTDVPEPAARPVETFAGGVMVFAFGPKSARDGYEVVTMYPRPSAD
jgi:hypothetical protein